MSEIDLKSNQKIGIPEHLKEILTKYLNEKPHMSLAAISKRCQVSEPTLRRIRNNKIKTIPTTSTILNFLYFIYGTTNVSQIIDQCKGPVGDYLNEVMPQAKDSNSQFDQELNEELSDKVKYMIFKLAANRNGTDNTAILRLFGEYGLRSLKELIQLGYIVKRHDRFYWDSEGSFSLDPELFNRNFKCMANYISQDYDPAKGLLNPFHTNYSETVSPEAYRQIAQEYRKAMKKIRKICDNDSSSGDIPMFFISALDVLDNCNPKDYLKN